MAEHQRECGDVSINIINGEEEGIKRKKGNKKIGKLVFLIGFELVAFACGLVFFIMSLTIDRLNKHVFWDIGLAKFCILILSIILGRLISQFITMLILFLIWRFWWVKERALYFGYGVRKSVMLFLWVGQVALAWGLIVDRSKYKTDIVNDVTRGLSGFVIANFLWLIKTCLVMFVGSIHATKFLDKIREAVIVRRLLVSLLEMPDKSISNNRVNDDHHRRRRVEDLESLDLVATNVFDKMFDWNKHDEDKADSSSRKARMEWITCIRRKTLISLPLVDHEKSVRSANEAAKEAAAYIFAQFNPDSKSRISLEKILQFVKEKKVADQLKGLAESKKDHEPTSDNAEDVKIIEKSVFEEWMVEVYTEHDSLDTTLKLSKTATDELNVIASLLVMLVIIVMWLLFMRFLTTEVLVFLSSQILLAAFIFGNSVKTAFECVIFVFLVHPFDVGDRCVINGVQMVVEEMNIATTTFLRYDNEKIYYPNSVLASKPISNLYRSPPMSESVEFSISLHTPNPKIEELQKCIKTYLKTKPLWWRPDHSLQFKEIEDLNKMKLALCLNHTINFHYMGKRMRRRSELVLHMKYLFEKLEIEYNLLPQRVNLLSPPSSAQYFIN